MLLFGIVGQMSRSKCRLNSLALELQKKRNSGKNKNGITQQTNEASLIGPELFLSHHYLSATFLKY